MLFFSQKKMFQKKLADIQQQMEAIQRQHSDIVSTLNTTIATLHTELQQIQAKETASSQECVALNDKLKSLNNELQLALTKEAIITQECVVLKEQLRLATDPDYVKQNLEENLKQIATHYEIINTTPYADGFQLRYITKKINIHNVSSQTAREAMFKKVLIQIEQFSTLREKINYCQLLLEKPIAEHRYEYEALYLAVRLWKYFKETDKDLYAVLERLLKDQMGIPNSNDLIKERKSTRITSPVFSSDIEDNQYKMIFWEILSQCEDLDIQTLGLNSIIDRCHDNYEYNSSFGYSSFFDLYETPQDYFIAELIAEDYPNRAQILQQAVERVCLYEKYYRREREEELMCLLREAILANTANTDAVQTIFEQTMAIERISIARVLLQWLCDDETLLSICRPQIIWLLDALQEFIKTKPEPYRHIECLIVCCYTKRDVVEFWSLHNRTQIAEIKSGLSNIAEALDKLWREQISGGRYTEVIRDYSIELRYNAFPMGNLMPLGTVHRPQSLKELARKVYKAASQKGDRVAKRILANLNLDLITLEELAVAGEVESMFLLAWNFKHSDQRAEWCGKVHWFRQAAEAGYVNAMTSLGYQLSLSILGLRADRNYEEAFTWLQKAANFGDAEAMKNLGKLYENGWGVPKDPIKAKEYRVMSLKSLGLP